MATPKARFSGPASPCKGCNGHSHPAQCVALYLAAAGFDPCAIGWEDALALVRTLSAEGRPLSFNPDAHI